MASANATLAALTPEFFSQVQTTSKAAFAELETWKELPNVITVRGLGLMIGIQLAENVPAGALAAKLHEYGLLTLTAEGNTLRLLPPLIISQQALLTALATIKSVIAGY
jgi:acetylornithine aminotransferase